MARDLLVTLVVSIALNLVMFLAAFKFKTDRLTDGSYALTFILLALYGLWRGGADGPKLVLTGMVVLWALRLGGFLLMRIWRTGTDKRFDGVRDNFWKFGKFWLAQGVSVWVIVVPALLMLLGSKGVFTALSGLGLTIWAAGVLIESTADIQKYRFTQNPANKDKWIDSGIWSYSRHPNYFGEILTWIGVYMYVFASLSGVGRIVGLCSPLFITTLLLFISGLPPLEKGADARWGKLAAYQAYKRRTSILLLLPHKK